MNRVSTLAPPLVTQTAVGLYRNVNILVNIKSSRVNFFKTKFVLGKHLIDNYFCYFRFIVR